MRVYEICVSGYEAYEPVLFETKLSKEEFQKRLIEAIDYVLPKILKSYNFINGHTLFHGTCLGDETSSGIINYLEQDGEIKIIKPDHVFDFRGECIYKEKEFNSEDDKPDFIPQSLWDKIIKHNNKIHKELYDDIAKRNSEKSNI